MDRQTDQPDAQERRQEDGNGGGQLPGFDE